MHPRQEPTGCVLILFSEQDRGLVPIAKRFESSPGHGAVGVNEAAPFDRCYGKVVQNIFRRRGNAGQTNAADPRAIFLGRNHDHRFPRDPKALGILSIHERFIDFDPAVKLFSSRTDHGSSQLVQPGPGRLITPEPEDPLDVRRARAVLLAGRVPHSPEPHRQWRTRVLKDRARRYGRLVATLPADQPSARSRPGRASSAARAHKPVRPAQPKKIIAARFIRREPQL